MHVDVAVVWDLRVEVVALEGDTIEVRDNEVYVNDQKLARDPTDKAAAAFAKGSAYLEKSGDREYVIQLDGDAEKARDFAKATVPRGCCFVLGDNRNKSRDSREIGFVPLGDVLGPVQYIFWPAKSWSRFGKL